jgi:hypothetical protein
MTDFVSVFSSDSALLHESMKVTPLPREVVN